MTATALADVQPVVTATDQVELMAVAQAAVWGLTTPSDEEAQQEVQALAVSFRQSGSRRLNSAQLETCLQDTDAS